MFGKSAAAKAAAGPAAGGARHADFGYLAPADRYLDSACQSLRPQPVIDTLVRYYTESNACGGRVRYAWGRTVDEGVADARERTLRLLRRHGTDYSVSFTLNTTMGLGLLLHQATGFDRVVTSTAEHNSVFLGTIAAAKRLGLPRVVLDRDEDGTLRDPASDLERALVVVSVASNFDGSRLRNLRDLVRDTHAVGGAVVLDAAQAMGHAPGELARTEWDALVFSSHKAYGPSLGVVVARTAVLDALETRFVGGGMVSAVTRDGYTLTPGDHASRLEPGSQAWAEILGYGAAQQWLQAVRFDGQNADARLESIGARLQAGLAEVPGLVRVGHAEGPVATVFHPKIDSHRLAQYASSAGVMLRSGYFCAHYELKEHRGLPPLLRFSAGLHSSFDDIDEGVAVLRKLVAGLA